MKFKLFDAFMTIFCCARSKIDPVVEVIEMLLRAVLEKELLVLMAKLLKA